MKNLESKSRRVHEGEIGGVIRPVSCAYIGSTGEKQLDDQIMKLVKSMSGVSDECLLAEMMITAVRIARGSVPAGEFKMMNQAVKEMRTASEVFQPYAEQRKVTVYGSARTKPDDKTYQTTVEFCQKITKHGFMTMTGAGPGIMAAGNEGAGRENSFGLNILLPFESMANDFIAGDSKLMEFDYFFTRKLSFIKESDASVAMPGGFGTMDELFEALTLIQTGKTPIYPIVLLDEPEGTYWKLWRQFIRENLQHFKLIADSDFSLFKVTNSVDEAVAEILQFYRVFHSYRYVGDRLVFRLQKELSDAAVQELNQQFEGILKSGSIKKSAALAEEIGGDETLEMPRLVFRHRRGNYGKLRELINTINDC